MTSTQLIRRQRRRINIRGTAAPWSRAWRRALDRDQARKHAAYNGPAPRYEAARNDTCSQHHRQLPCTRCTEPGTE